MKQFNNKTSKVFNRFFKRRELICKAPWVSISMSMDGTISPCCYTLNTDRFVADSKWGEHSLKEVWTGNVFEEYRKKIKNNIFPDACSICKEKIQRKAFDSVKTLEFDRFNEKTKYPLIIEISVDNTCNLECVMCNSVSSSKIAEAKGVKNQGINDYDRLFEELKEFIPHAEEMIFTGGEPFLSRFYFNIWKEIIKTNPNCKITLNTNATIITEEAKEIIEQGNFSFNLSIDSFDKDSYEQIRKNADFDTTFSNFKYLLEYSHRKNVPLAVAVCPLVSNFKDIPNLLEVCTQHNAYVHFVHVFGAHSFALSSADEIILDQAIKMYSETKLRTNIEIEQHNASQFEALISDVKQWKIDNRIIKEYLDEIDIEASKDLYLVEYEKLIGKSDNIDVNKLNSVFEMLPEYFRTAQFISLLNDIPVNILVEYLSNLPEDEISEYFRILFNEKASSSR